jgi:hypothetical protein
MSFISIRDTGAKDLAVYASPPRKSATASAKTAVPKSTATMGRIPAGILFINTLNVVIPLAITNSDFKDSAYYFILFLQVCEDKNALFFSFFYFFILKIKTRVLRCVFKKHTQWI